MSKQQEHQHHPIGLDGRTRDKNGQIRHKRSDTKISTLRDEYGEEIGGKLSDEDTLADLLEQTDEPSLSQYLKKN